MKKTYTTRILAIACLCLVTLLLKSEDKAKTTQCILSESTADGLQARVKFAIETAAEEPLTYYGFYSKY